MRLEIRSGSPLTPALKMLVAAVATVCVSLSTSAQQAAPGPGAPPQALTLPSPSFPAVVKAMSDPRQALVVLDKELASRGTEVPIEAVVLRAHLLSAASRYQEAIATWDQIASRDESLASFARRSAFAAALAARDLDAARSRIATIVTGEPGAARLSSTEADLLWLSLAEAYQSSKQFDQAAGIYRDVLGRQAGNAAADRARVGLAASEEALGHFDVALTLWHDATLSWRSADTYGTGRTGERRVAAKLDREPPPFTEQQYFDVAERLSTQSHFDDAATLLEEGKRRGVITAVERLAAALVDVLYRGRRNDEAMSRANDFLARFPDSREAPDVRLTQLRLDIRTGNLASARKRLAALTSTPGVPADVRESGGRLVAGQLVATGSAREGLALFRKLAAATRVRADRYDFSWHAGIAAIRLGDSRAAAPLFAQARKFAPGRSLPRSAVYWQAVALAATGARQQARGLWDQLIDENAYDYYGLRAAERLRRQAVGTTNTDTLAFPPLELSPSAVAAPELQAATTLARAGLDEDAASVLRRLAGRLSNDRALALLAARGAYGAEDYAAASSLVVSRFPLFLAHPATGVPADVWQMAFPRAFWPEVAAAASKANVDPLLLLALMRRESRFVVTARSRTGALGLFQIMPYTARELAPTPEEAPSGEALLAAPSSAELAARLVKRLDARFDNAVAPVVASYNAGEDRVSEWWKAAAGLPEDLFVDSIPYAETRQYVREVLANYATYRRLYR